jgi:hypothetical protein
MKDIKVGIELEGIYNNDVLKESVKTAGGYGFNRGIPVNSFWKHSSDSSLSPSGEFPHPTTAEIIQFPVVGRERFVSSLKAFQELALGNELKDFAAFNSTCGCHIHFSIPENLYKNIFVSHIEKMRDNFFTKLKNSDLRPELVKGIIKHYDRDFSRKIVKSDQENISKGNLDKRTELHVSCEREGKGVEWRSFNLLGVQSWEEFYKVLSIGYDCVEDFLASLKKLHMEESVSIKTPKIPRPKSITLTIPAGLKRFKRCAI